MVEVGVGVLVEVGVGVFVGVGVGVFVGVGVGVLVGVGVGVLVGVGVGVFVFVGVGVLVGVDVRLGTLKLNVHCGDAGGSPVGLGVGVGVRVVVGVDVPGWGVGVGVVAPRTVTWVEFKFLVTSPALPRAAVCVPESKRIWVAPPEGLFARKSMVAMVAEPCFGSPGLAPRIIEAVPLPT